MMDQLDYAGSISLKQEMFRNLTTAQSFALDIGGSLAKIAYQSRRKRRRTIVCEAEEEYSDSLSGIYDGREGEQEVYSLHFVKFQTSYLEECLTFIQDKLMDRGLRQSRRIKVTGGGAYKFRDMIEEKLGVISEKEDEMECLIRGCVFLLNNINDEVFSYNKSIAPAYCFQAPSFVREDCFPFLLVNIGSGVSCMKVESDTVYSRIGGTSLGGGTFWGIGTLLSNVNDFDELLRVAEAGDHRRIDMLIGDICGGSDSFLGLHSSVVASSFGKVARQKDLNSSESNSSQDQQMPQYEFSKEDLLKSLLITISNNIGHIAYLLAKNHCLSRIIFGGFFIRGHPTTMNMLTYAINFWSEGSMKAFFLRHEGYLGAIGAFLKGAEEDACRPRQWTENYYGSTEAMSPYSRPRGLSIDHLELDHVEQDMMTFLRLADPVNYNPDSWNLTSNKEARSYWLKIFRDSMDRHAKKAVESQPDSKSALERADRYRAKFINFLDVLEKNPCAYGALTVRSILEAHENFLHEFEFDDPYLETKRRENEDALRCLSARLAALANMEWETKQLELILGVLTGNIFDWGASAVREILDTDEDFGFSRAMGKLQKRPWLVDDFDDWLLRLRDGPRHKCALIFCDNSGFDIIMGILPLALELISNGTRVILCVNSGPSLNDVTYPEMCIILRRLGSLNQRAAEAINDGKLIVHENGQSSPCLDLRQIPRSLNVLAHRHEVDLVVIDGMGRSLHTNYFASFTCDCLKVAVIKNKWVCQRLGGDSLFSVVCKFERRNS